MGAGDKATMLVGGRAMLAIVAERMGSQVGALAVSANGNLDPLLLPGVPILPDGALAFEGPLAGLLAGMSWARRAVPSATWIATSPTDAPFLPLDLVGRLLAASSDVQTTRLAASRGRIHPVFGLWPLDLASALADWLAAGSSRRVRDWVAAIPHVVVDFDRAGEPDPFFNVNTPDDLEAARSRIA
jgi:molybdopterin-guanine dinucleotide biosynthesis protein A